MNTHLNSDNHILFKQVKANDITAFNFLFKKYYALLCDYAHRYVSMEDAKEIVQETFIWIWENKERITIESSFNSYLYRMIYNRTMNHIAHLDCIKRADDFYYQKTADRPVNFDAYDFKELKENVVNIIADLPESYKEAVIMYRFKDMTYNEIAVRLGVSTKTVDYRIRQAYKIVRLKLKGYLQIPPRLPDTTNQNSPKFRHAVSKFWTHRINSNIIKH